MDFNTDIMSRAFQRAGEDELTDEDIEQNTSKYRTIKAFYLSTFLRILSEADWTELKVRKQLTDALETNYSSYAYGYTLPVDCARAISIDDNALFEIEGNILYTDTAEPVLLYITNGKREQVTALPEAELATEVYYKGKHYSWSTTDKKYIEDEEQEDAPLYDELDLSPELTECFEYHLASQIALKLSGDKSLFNQLLEYAMAIQSKAQKTSREHGISKQTGHTWWSEQLGLTTKEDDKTYVNY